jgi:hypothetical protein
VYHLNEKLPPASIIAHTIASGIPLAHNDTHTGGAQVHELCAPFELNEQIWVYELQLPQQGYLENASALSPAYMSKNIILAYSLHARLMRVSLAKTLAYMSENHVYA